MKFNTWNFFSSKNNQLYYLILSFYIMIVVGYLFCVFLYPLIDSDPGYYLKVAYDLVNGKSFFKDINCSYSPLAMYILSIPFYIDKNTGAEFLYFFLLILYPIIGILFYKVLRYFNENKKVCLFYTIILITANIILEGYHVLLEPYVLLFQLIALWLILSWENKKWKIFLSGFFVFLAFFTKQYGVFILPGIVYFLYKEVKSIRLFLFNLQFLIAGILLPICFFTLYFVFVEGLLIEEFIQKLFAISALKGDEIVTGTDYLLTRLLAKNGELLIRFPFILLVGYLLFNKKKKTKSWFGLLLLGGSFCQLYFAYYNHYYQLIIPYFIITLVSLSKQFFQQKGKIILITSVFFIGSGFFELYKAFRDNKIMYQRQQVNISILTSSLPKFEKVYLQGISPAYYFLCKYNSPNLKMLGYKYPEELKLSTINKYLPSDAYIILVPNLLDNKEFNEYIVDSEVSLQNKKVVLLKKK